MLIKKLIYISVFALFAFAFPVVSCGTDISASSAVVINADTKEIIFEKNASDKKSMASTTKIMTSILAIESGRLGDRVTVTDDALTEGSSVGLKTGYVLTLESLVYGMMLESGNDAANVCALHLGGTFEDFAVLMNSKAKKLGMDNTNFVTPSGLDDEKHYSTAYDMALLGAYSIKNPVFREICSDKSQKITLIEPEMSVTFSNHNRLLGSCEGVFGIKTGFTKKSGRCLVSACERNGATLVCVTLNAGDDWNDHAKLYDLSFSELNRSTISFSAFSEVTVYGGKETKAKIYADEYVYHFLESDGITEQIILPEIIYAPVKKNEIIGRVNYFSDGNLIHTSYIYSESEITASDETYKRKASFYDWIKDLLSKGKD